MLREGMPDGFHGVRDVQLAGSVRVVLLADRKPDLIGDVADEPARFPVQRRRDRAAARVAENEDQLAAEMLRRVFDAPS